MSGICARCLSVGEARSRGAKNPESAFVLYFLRYFVFPASTFLTLLLFPLKDDVLVVLAPPGDGGGRGALGLADQGGVVVLAHAHRRWRAVQVDDVRRN